MTDTRFSNLEPSDKERLDTTANMEPMTPLPGPGRALAWLVFFGALFFGAAFLYAAYQGAVIGITQPDIVEDDALLESMIVESVQSPAGLAWVSLLQFVLLVPVIVWTSNFRTQSWRHTLAVHAVSWRQFGFWMLVYCGYFLVQSILELLVPVDMGELIYGLSGSRHLGLFLAFVFLAPVIEELVFRGYLFKAWRHTRLGLWGTLLLTSVLFTALHGFQYPWITLIYLFALSLLLGLAREKTGSVLTPVALHMLNNAFAMSMLLYFEVL